MSDNPKISTAIVAMKGATTPHTRTRPTMKVELDIPPAAWAVIVAVIFKVLGILPMI